MREIVEQITAGSLMVGTPIILFWRPISLGLIKDLCNHAITVWRHLKWQRSRNEGWSCRESNPGPSAYRAKCSATELQLPPATTPQWSLIRPKLIGLRTRIIGVPTIGLPAVICSVISLINNCYGRWSAYHGNAKETQGAELHVVKKKNEKTTAKSCCAPVSVTPFSPYTLKADHLQ